MADWSLLPKDLLELINGRFESCFEIVHFRSVCSSWRSAVPPPSNRHGLGVNSLLPIFNDNPRFDGDKHCTLQKIPVFLFRFQTPFGDDYLLVGVVEGESGILKLFSPLEDSSWRYKEVTLNILRPSPTTLLASPVRDALSCQIFPLGYYYKINFYAITTRRYRTRRENCCKKVAFFPLDSDDGNDYAVVAGVLGDLMMYRSRDKSWINIERGVKSYRDMVLFKGKFYVVDMTGSGRVFVIKPSLEVSEIQSVTQSDKTFEERLVVSGDELLLVQRFTPGSYGHKYKHSWFKLFKLEEEGQGRWTWINDLEDRVVFLGYDWNLCYSAKELTGIKRNSVVFFQPNSITDRILVFDLGTRKTSNAFTACRCYMGAFGNNLGSLVSCGTLTLPNPPIYDLDSEDEFHNCYRGWC